MSLTALEALDRSWQPARSVELDDLRLQVDRVERRSLAGCRLHNLGSGQQAAAGPRWRGGSARIESAIEFSCGERATMCDLGGRLRLGHGLCLGWSWLGLAARVLLGRRACGRPPMAGLASCMLVQVGGVAALPQPQPPHLLGAFFG